MKKSTDISASIQACETQFVDLSARLAAADDEKTKANSEREACLVGALADNDPAARRKLDEVTERAARASRDAIDLELVIKQLNARLEALRGDLRDAERQAAEQEIRRLAEERIAAAADVDELLERLVPVLRRLVDLSDTQENAARRLGWAAHTLRARPGIVGRLQHALWPLFASDFGMPSPHYQRSLAEIERTLFHGGAEIAA